MYNVYDEKNEKAFGCSSLPAVIKYMTEVGVISVLTTREVRINLANGEHIILKFGCPTSAHDWITTHVPGKLMKVVSRKGGSEYKYK